MKQGQSLERQFLVKEESESGRCEMCQKMLASKLVKSVPEKAERATKSNRNKGKKKRSKPSLECLNLE